MKKAGSPSKPRAGKKPAVREEREPDRKLYDSAPAGSRPIPGEIALTRPDQTEAQLISELASDGAVNAASLMHAFHGNILRDQNDFHSLLAGVDFSVQRVKNGDMAPMEAMLVAQAIALQSMFTSLARRAVKQDFLRQYETYMALALKAQAQSRATIQALVDLKYPRHATFVKQANIAHGHQQVNNGAVPPGDLAHAENADAPQNKLLEVDHGQSGSGLDTTAPAAAKRGHPELAPVGEIHGAENGRGESEGRAKRRQGR